MADQLTPSDVGAPARTKINAAIQQLNAILQQVPGKASQAAVDTLNVELADLRDLLGDKAALTALAPIQTAITNLQNLVASKAGQDVFDDAVQSLLGQIGSFATNLNAFAQTAADLSTKAGALQLRADAVDDRLETTDSFLAKTRTAILFASDRPGDGVSNYTGAPLPPSDPLAAADMDPARIVTTVEGKAVRLTGEQWVIDKRRHPLEPGRIGRVRFALFRTQNADDPSNDAIQVGVLCYNASGAFIANAALELYDNVTTETGRIDRSYLVSRDTDVRPGVVNISPNTRSVRPYVYTYGGNQQTNVEVIAFGDVTDIVNNGDAQLIGSGNLIGITSVRLGVAAGAQPAFGGRGFVIPIGQTGLGTLAICSLPAFGFSPGTRIKVHCFFESSADLGPTTTPGGFTANVDMLDGSQVVAPPALLFPLQSGAYRGEFPYTIVGGETQFNYWLFIASAGTRATQAYVVLRSTQIEVLGSPAGVTVNDEYARYAEQARALLVQAPDRRDIIEVAADARVPLFINRIRDGVAAASGSSAGPNEHVVISVAPGTYADECSPTTTIDPPAYVDIIGQGRPDEQRIVARFPDNQPGQESIQPIYWKTGGRIANLDLDVQNVRYGVHIDAGNAKIRALQEMEDVTVRHRGATVWNSPSAFGVGQHEGNRQIYRRVRAFSPYAALGIHNNTNWTRPSGTRIEDCELHATTDYGNALVFTSNGAGIVSPVTIDGTIIGGHVLLNSFFLTDAALSAHKANRYEYALNVRASGPFDFTGECKVPALRLASVAGPNSSVAVSAPGVPVLFGVQPDTREGAADYAARIDSGHAIDVLAGAGEADPGVTLGARLGNRSGSPLPLTVVFDGGPAANLSLNIDFRGMSNGAVIVWLNEALATAMGGSTGGRGFSAATPYDNRPPIFQRDREVVAFNADSATILKGHALAWTGGKVRRMTAADDPRAWAGIALDDAIPGRMVRSLATGWIGQAHILFDGAPAPVAEALYQISASSPGRLVAGTGKPLLVVRSTPDRGAVFEIAP